MNPPTPAEPIDPVFASDTQTLREVFGLSAPEHWFDLAADGIVCLDSQRRVLSFNRAAGETFDGALTVGQPARQSIPLWNLLEELNVESLLPADSKEGTQQVVREIVLHKGTVRVPLEVAATLVAKAGRRIFILVTRASTQGSAARQALYQSQKRQVIGSLAGGIAHDFNNILTAVIGNLDLALSEEELAPFLREVLTQALNSARRGAELNTKLLAFSRQTDAQPVPVKVARLIEETIFILRRSIDPRIRIKLAPVAGEIQAARVDEGQFMQVLMNLCLNARDAMPEGGEITFLLANCTFTAGEVRAARQAGEFVQVTVADTGRGMAPEILSRLFEPYFTTKEFGKGAGLGLSIANHVVVEAGGWMEVESQPGKGTRFHVFLPRTNAPATAEIPAPPAANQPMLDGSETILLVDDEQPVRTVVNAVLAYRGYKIIEAVNGVRAIEQFRASGDAIQLVLLDIRMPEMNGWDTMKRLRELNPRVPILLLSGGSMDSSEDRASLSGASGILRKPFTGAEVLRAVREVLDRTKVAG